MDRGGMCLISKNYNRKKATKIFLSSAISFFLLILLGNIHSLFGYLAYLPLAGLILLIFGFLVPIQSGNRNRQMLNEEISYLSLDDTGLYINLFNNSDSLVYVPWENIKKIEFDFTIHKPKSLGIRLQRYAEWIPDVKIIWKWSAPDPDLAFSLYFSTKSTTNQRSMSSIQIPNSWIENGKFNSLCKSIEVYSGLTIKPLDYSRLNVGIFKSQVWENKNQQLINYYYQLSRTIK